MICVRDLLKLEVFEGINLASGKDGLYRRVAWPNLAQTDQIQEWLVGGDVIIVSGVGLDTSGVFLTNYVREAIDGNAACMVVFISKQFIKDIPDETLVFAEQNNFPIFKAPWNTKISNLIKEISTLAVRDQYMTDYMNEFVEELLLGNLDYGSERNQNNLREYNLYLPHAVVKAEIDYRVSQKEDDVDAYSFEQQIKMQIIREMKMQDPNLLFLVKKQSLIMIVGGKEESELVEILESIGDHLTSFYKKRSVKVRFGIGGRYSQPNLLVKSFKDADNVLKIKKDYRVVTIAHLGIFKFFTEERQQAEIVDYAKERLAPLLKNDQENNVKLLPTLKMYLSENRNYITTAEKMFIHRNTLVKRIYKIEEILGIDIKNGEMANDLYNCCTILSYFE